MDGLPLHDLLADHLPGGVYYPSSLWDPGNCGSPGSWQSSTATITAFCKTFQVAAGATYVMNEIRFDQSLSGKAVTIVFTHQPVGGGATSTSTINVTVP